MPNTITPNTLKLVSGQKAVDLESMWLNELARRRDDSLDSNNNSVPGARGIVD